MALINIQSALDRVFQILKKTPTSQGVEILSYKRNRGITIIKQDDYYRVSERGHHSRDCVSEPDQLPKLLKNMIKKEFPRSRKLRIYRLTTPSDITKTLKKL